MCIAISVYRNNAYTNHYVYYIYILFLLLGSLAVGAGVASNIHGILNPAVLAESAKISTQEKVKSYNLFILVIFYIPAAFNFLTFWLYQKSLKYVFIGKNEDRKIKNTRKKAVRWLW